MRLKRPPAGTPKLYEQDGLGEQAVVWAHYFASSSDWLITEYDPVEDLGFGWCCLNGDRQSAELGYVSLAELEELHLRTHRSDAGLIVVVIDYDDDWQPTPLADAIAEIDRRLGRG